MSALYYFMAAYSKLKQFSLRGVWRFLKEGKQTIRLDNWKFERCLNDPPNFIEGIPSNWGRGGESDQLSH